MESIESIFNSGEKIFFTSDTHFNHENIMHYCKRPFASIEEHDTEIARKWNEKVPEDGLVFHLGDFAFNSYVNTIEILQSLNGKKVLIIGNHDWKNLTKHLDRKCKGATLREQFAAISQQMFIKVEEQKIYLNHFPFLCMNGVFPKQEQIWQLYGHVHSGPNATGLDMPRLEMCFPNQYDVGVDNNNYAPVSFYELKQIMESRMHSNALNVNE